MQHLANKSRFYILIQTIRMRMRQRQRRIGILMLNQHYEQVHLSPGYLTDLFIKETGLSPAEYRK